MKEYFRMAVVETDIDSSGDTERIVESGIHRIHLQTGGFCHLDVPMAQQGLDSLDMNIFDLVFIENVGNLVLLGLLIKMSLAFNSRMPTVRRCNECVSWA